MSASAWPPPGAGEVHLWWIDLTLAASAREHLTDAERVRATGFRRSGDGEQWGAARGALRQILAHYTGEPPARLRLEAGPHGKPALAPAGTTDLRFNLTHTGDRALLAIAWQREVGIDLVSWETGAALRGDLDALIATTCSGNEAAWLRSLDGEARGRAFLRLWTVKEACLKAAGVGLFRDPRTVDVVGALTLDLGPGWEAALAVEGPMPRIVWRHWPV